MVYEQAPLSPLESGGCILLSGARTVLPKGAPGPLVSDVSLGARNSNDL